MATATTEQMFEEITTLSKEKKTRKDELAQLRLKVRELKAENKKTPEELEPERVSGVRQRV